MFEELTDVTKHYDNPFCACKECREIKGHEIVRIGQSVVNETLFGDEITVAHKRYRLICIKINKETYEYKYKFAGET